MSSCRVAPVLLLAVAAACLPDSLDTGNDTNPSGTGTGTDTDDTGTPTGGPVTGLFACDRPRCTLVFVSQTLDDRVDIYDADTRTLRGRIDLDLKPDPTGKQITGNLLDEPYELALTDTDLLITLGHYPDTDRGSILRFPRGVFSDLEPGQTFAVDRYFNPASLAFNADVQPLTHSREEGIFLLPHPSGRILIGVFANNLKVLSEGWSNPSELLVWDPTDLDIANVGSFDLGGLDRPCIGGWRLEALDAAVTKVAVACDGGKKSVAVLTLPADFATLSPADAAAGITGCGYEIGGNYFTQFVSADGGGNMLAVQSQLTTTPRVISLDDKCIPAFSSAPPDDLKDLKILRQPVLARPASEGAPLWLIASAVPSDVVVARGGGKPALCGRLAGLDLLEQKNSPWALALDSAGEHLAIGAGPPNQPEMGDGTGQILWGTLDRSGLDACTPTLTDVVDLNAGLFSASDPSTWVRAPNVIKIVELEGPA